jgi:pyruvate dehydrogenase E2 component (dihydrolipoamide acetyltransferase)
MKSNILSKLALIAGVSMVAAFGEDAAAPAAAPAAPAAKAAPAAPAAPAAKAEKAPAAKTVSISGTVVSTDAIANTIVVKTKKAEETVSIAPTSKIMLGKKEIKLADVSKDQKVKVSYTEENGAKTATSVKVSAAAPAKKAATSTAAAPQ